MPTVKDAVRARLGNAGRTLWDLLNLGACVWLGWQGCQILEALMR